MFLLHADQVLALMGSASACWTYEFLVVKGADEMTSIWLQYAGLLMPICLMLTVIYAKSYRQGRKSVAVVALVASLTNTCFIFAIPRGSRADFGYLASAALQFYVFYSGALHSTGAIAVAALAASAPLMAWFNNVVNSSAVALFCFKRSNSLVPGARVMAVGRTNEKKTGNVPNTKTC